MPEYISCIPLIPWKICDQYVWEQFLKFVKILILKKNLNKNAYITISYLCYLYRGYFLHLY